MSLAICRNGSAKAVTTASSSWASCWAKWCSRDLTTTQLNARNTKVVAMPSRAVTLNASDAGRLRRGLWREVIIRRIERVSHATYSVDELWIERIVDLCAQTTDGHINDVAVAVEIHVPYLRRNQRTRQNFTLSACQQFEQRELLAGEIDALTSARCTSARQVQHQIGNLDAIRLARSASASQQRPHPRQQFRERERLHEIDLYPQLQPLDAVIYAATCGYKYHRDFFSSIAQRTHHAPPIDIQH